MENPLSSVTTWVYHLGDVDAAEASNIADSGADLVVIDLETSGSGGDLRPYTSTEIDAMRATQDTVVLSYLSIGEAEEYRDYWEASWYVDPPDFLASANPEWPDNYKVKYWDPDWQAIIFDRVDQAVASGFNGVYLDIVDGYQFWEDAAPNAGIDYAAEMAAFVAAIRARGEAAMAAAEMTGSFTVVGQNAEELVTNQTYLDAIDGLAKEDLRFIYENGRENQFKKVPEGWYTGSLEYLQQAADAGVEIFVVEYMTQQRQAQHASTLAQEIEDLAGLKAPLYIAEERDLLQVYTLVPAEPTDPGGPGGATDGDDTLNGTAAADTILGLGGNDTVSGGGGNDLLDGGNGTDWLYGGSGNDVLIGGAGIDRLFGGSGNDVIDAVESGAQAADVIDGGVGFDKVSYAAAVSGVTVNLANTALNAGAAAGESYTGIEGVIGSSAGGNTLIGNAAGNVLIGGGGSVGDVLNGGGGADWLYGRSGNDVLVGGDGVDRLFGGAGNDVINPVESGAQEADVIYGGVGFDKVSYATALAGVTVNLANNALNAGAAAGESYTGIEGVIGSSAGGNTLTGDAGGNVLIGGGGTVGDRLVGGGGVDWLYGNGADDVLIGGAAKDWLFGGVGMDSLFGGDGNDVLVGGAGVDRMFGGSGNDVIDAVESGAQAADVIDGGVGFDKVSYATAVSGVTVNLANNALNAGAAAGESYTGIEGVIGSSAGGNTLTGDAGGNVLYGGGGTVGDVLDGGGGTDWLYGGSGNDVLIGGAGADWMSGGPGADRFVYASSDFGQDTIIDWEDGVDRLDMTGAGLTFADFSEMAKGSGTLLVLTADPSQSIYIAGTDPSQIDAADFV